MNDLLQTLVSTLIQGSILALITVGMTLAYGCLRVLNMAQGAMLMLGGFAAYSCSASWHLPVVLSLLVAAALTLVLGVGTYYIGVMPLLHRIGVDFEMTAFISTFALATIAQNVALLVWGPRQRGFPVLVRGQWRITDAVSITWHSVLMSGIAVALLIALGVFLSRSRYGLAITAVAQNVDAARLMGIPARKVYAITMGIAAALAGIGGVLLAPVYFVSPNSGDLPLLQALVIVIFAGLGSVKGNIYAAYAVGFVQSAVSVYWTTTYALPGMYLVILIVLFFRPYGIAGKPQEVRL